MSDLLQIEYQNLLNDGQTNSLYSKLDNTDKALDRERIKAAVNKLMVFINEVETHIQSGKLTQAQGQPPIDAAQAG
jgi:hypothetical protein